MAAIIPFAAGAALGAEDKAAPEVIAPRQPLLGSAFPMGVTVGRSSDIEILGEHLDGVTSLSSDCEGLQWVISEASAIRLKARVQASESARPGPCFFHAQGARGLTNRLLFRVSAWNTSLEQEPNDFPDEASEIEVNSIVHGRITRINDSDFFRFQALKGQRAVFSLLSARNALNGHFALTLLDGQGKELAHNHYGVGPDPSLDYTFAQSGTVTVVITSRRSGDFFSVIGDNTPLNWQYQLSVGQSPVPKSLFPSGGKRGTSVSAELKVSFLDAASKPVFTGRGVKGRLHPSTDSCNCRFKLDIDIAADADLGEHFLSFPDASGNTLLLGFVVSEENELFEKEPNDREEVSQELSLPATINGRIGEPGDRDRFRIKINPDDDLTFSVAARGLGSQMTDPYVAVLRVGGDLTGVGDDRCQQRLGKDEGCPAYFASVGRKEKLDPEASHRFVSLSANDADAAGEYIVQMADMSGRGGEENNYRLTIRKRSPGFLLGINAARVIAAAGTPAKVPVVVLRREGFRGRVEVRVNQLPEGWTARPLVLEGEEESGMLEIIQAANGPAAASIAITGTAVINKAEVVHAARLTPFLAEDGFGYIEAPESQLPVSFVDSPRFAISFDPPKGGAIVDLRRTVTLALPVTVKRAQGFRSPVSFFAESLPPGVTLRSTEDIPGGKAALTLVADPAEAKPGIYRIALRGVAEEDGGQVTDVSPSFRFEVRQ